MNDENWWTYSEKQGDGATDVVVEYTTITLVYEYDNTEATEPSQPTTEEPDDKLIGDVNADGTVAVADAALFSKWLLGEKAEINAANSDVIADGKYNVFDLAALKRMLTK